MSTMTGRYTITLDDDPEVHRIIAAATDLPSIPYDSVRTLLEEASQREPVACFLDIHLGEEQTGLDIVPELRKLWTSCPILIITSDDREATVTEALSTGADDFIQKPLKPAEILARFQARLRDVEVRRAQQEVHCGDLTINLAHSQVKSLKGQRFLSPTEMNLLIALVQGAGSVVPRASLKRLCWGRIAVSDSALDRKVFEVRRVVKDLSDALQLRTVYGQGIALQPAEGEELAAPY